MFSRSVRFAAGFVAARTNPASWSITARLSASFAACSFVMLALVHEVRDDEFVCHLDPAYVVETRAVTSEDPPEVALPGLSGSPAFMVPNDPTKLVVPQLCGVVTQGVDLGHGNLIVRYARLGRLGPSGQIA